MYLSISPHPTHNSLHTWTLCSPINHSSSSHWQITSSNCRILTTLSLATMTLRLGLPPKEAKKVKELIAPLATAIQSESPGDDLYELVWYGTIGRCSIDANATSTKRNCSIFSIACPLSEIPSSILQATHADINNTIHRSLRSTQGTSERSMRPYALRPKGKR